LSHGVLRHPQSQISDWRKAMSDRERPKFDRRAILLGTTSITVAGLMA
jgi:hypothetical protein